MKVLGIDPGARWTGWALLEKKSPSRDPRLAFLSCGVVDSHIQPKVEIQIPFADATLVIVESSFSVYQRKQFGLSMAGALVQSEHLAGSLLRYAESLGKEFIRCSATEARKALVGRPNSKDAEVARVVKLRVVDWPSRSSVHSRDGALVALYGEQKHKMEAAFAKARSNK